MSMLAERKKKQKWSLNPRGNSWAKDSNKFGQKLLEKMGWKEGKGLGANEDGFKDHIKVSYKNDSKGFGFKEKDEWTEHEDKFSSLLKDLSNSEIAVKIEKKSDDSAPKSLEKKSQNSKVRVHYHKFTRGKDLSRYSEKDLANIFGKKSLKEESTEEQVEAKNNSDEEAQNYGVHTVEGGSMIDYFKNRMTSFRSSSKYEVNKRVKRNSNSSDELKAPGFGFSNNLDENDDSKIKNGAHVNSFSFESENEVSVVQNGGEDELPKKAKKRKMSDENEITTTKKKKRAVDEQFEDSVKSSKKKKKEKKEEDNGVSNPAFDPLFSKEIPLEKHSLDTINEIEEDGECLTLDTSLKSEITGKKKNKKLNEFVVSEVEDDVEFGSKKKRKRVKSEDGFVNPNFESPKNISSPEIQDNNTFEVKTKKKKKKNVGIENPGFTICSPNQTGIDNPVFEPKDFEDCETTKSKKSKKKKKKMEDQTSPKNNTLNDTISEITVTNSMTSASDYVLNVSDEPDIMLNVSIGPPEYMKNDKEETPEVKSSSKKRKSVTFSEKNEKREIPNRKDEDNYYDSLKILEEKELFMKNMKNSPKNVGNGLINEAFDYRKDRIENKMQMMSERFEDFKAEIENNINETKNDKISEISVGEPITEGENEKLEDGVKLRLKYAEFGKTPYYMKNYSSDFNAKKSYKHLIKGDITVHFKNTNLHKVAGYGKKPKI